MKLKYAIIIIFMTILFIYLFFMRKTRVIYVHEDEYNTVIVVRNFPITQWGKIFWWENNKEFIKEKYGVLRNYNEGEYSIAILNESDGFKKDTEANFYWFSFEHTDLYCFDEIKSEKRCVEKNILMNIQNGMDKKIFYYIDGELIVK